MADDEMTLNDAAKLLGIDRSVMRRAMRRHNMRHRKLGERLILINRDDVEAYDITRKDRPAPPGQGKSEAAA